MFGERGLFVFSDPGGAKPILALAESLRDKLKSYLIISDRSYSFFKDFDVKVAQAHGTPSETIKEFDPDFIFTGTSYTSSIGHEYIKAAKLHSISVYTYVDHWTNIRERFDQNGIELLPDLILLVDEKAKKMAIDAGLPEALLFVSGNPYHDFLRKWQPHVSRPEFYELLDLQDEKKKIILYAPDPLSNVNGQALYGFDEVSATEKLVNSIRAVCHENYFLLNPHPNQKVERLQEGKDSCLRIVPADTDVNTLIYYSAIVIGYFSNLLVEATIMHKPVLRFFIKRGLPDPMEGMMIGEVVYPDTVLMKIKSLL